MAMHNCTCDACEDLKRELTVHDIRGECCARLNMELGRTRLWQNDLIRIKKSQDAMMMRLTVIWLALGGGHG